MNLTDDKPTFIAALNMALKLYSTRHIDLSYKKDSEGYEWLIIDTETSLTRVPITHHDCIGIMEDIVEQVRDDEENV